jgi:Mechanosensitive ion channel
LATVARHPAGDLNGDTLRHSAHRVLRRPRRDRRRPYQGHDSGGSFYCWRWIRIIDRHNNFVCGLILLFKRPIKVGDVVQRDSNIGEVRRIGIRAGVIRTTDSSEVIVPNGLIISNKVTNWTFSDRYRAVEVPVSAARGVAPQRVIELLKSVAANHPSVANEPAPQAYVVNLNPGSLTRGAEKIRQ